MRRYLGRAPQRYSLLSMLLPAIGMLVILVLLMRRTADPTMWNWMASDNEPAADAPATVPAAPPESPAASPGDQAPKATGPTDEDPEEADALKEELLAVTDKTLSLHAIEMQAYDRLVRWVRNQPISLLRQRAKRGMVFNDFALFADKNRGKLVELELNVRRILKYDEVNRDGVQLYEVWGWTNEAKAWLYVGAVADLPKGMPIGPNVYEKARLVGYFFKLQGYQPAVAKANATPLFAPLIVGKLVWEKVETPRMQATDWLWATVGIVVLLMVGCIALGALLLWPRRAVKRTYASIGPTEGVDHVEQWMNGLHGEATGDGHHPDPGQGPSADLGDTEGRDGRGQQSGGNGQDAPSSH